MPTRWKIILLVIYEIFVLNKIQCEWWDEEDGDIPRIFNADGPAKIGRHPHVVAVVNIGEYYARLLCVGVNIGTVSDKFGVVLTAGSCVNHIASGRIHKQQVLVVSNSEYWDCGCIRNEMSGILSYRLHPRYKEHVLPYIGEFNENDLGLLILKRPWLGIYNNRAVKSPIKFQRPTLVSGSITTLGWAFTSSENQTSDHLRISQRMNVIPGDQCKRKFYKKGFPKNSYCIVTEHPPGKGPCPYGPGAPVYNQNYRTTDLGLENTLVGIISKAPGCGDPSRPTIVVNTTAHLSFIKQWHWLKDVIKNNGKNLLQRSDEGEKPPIGKDWTCKKFPLGGKICCLPNKSQCIGVKANGLWWWVENKEGVDNSLDKGLGGKSIVWEDKIEDSDENDGSQENVPKVYGYVGRGVDGDGWTKIINPQQANVNTFPVRNDLLKNNYRSEFLLRNI